MPGWSAFCRWHLTVGWMAAIFAGFAQAQSVSPPSTQSVERAIRAAWPNLSRHDLILTSLIAGLCAFAVTLAILHMRSRRSWRRAAAQLRGDMETLKLRAERAEALLMSEPHMLAVWAEPTAAPDISGNLPDSPPLAANGIELALEAWFEKNVAATLVKQIEALRLRGEGFRRVARTLQERFVEVEGRAVSGRAIVRLREVTGDRLELAHLADRLRDMTSQMGAMRALLDEAPLPAWLRDETGRLTWVNKAYARAVDAKSEGEALRRGTELLDRMAREEAQRVRATGEPYLKRVPAVVGGARRALDVIDIPSAHGSAGMAIDVSELEAVRADLHRQMQAHVRTLDQMATAVAIFDADKKLTFHNAAFRSLWQLDAAFLATSPRDGEILDRLRGQRLLPEQVDFRAWKHKLHDAYRSIESAEHWWHLPGGRTLRVVTTPNPTGGVTYIFEDMTERLELESRFNALNRTQRETLDNLKEGVAAFGSDGRLRLFNPAFAAIWQLPQAMLEAKPHVDDVIAACAGMTSGKEAWSALKSGVTGFSDERKTLHSRMQREDGAVIDVSTVPLPDGGTLATFRDVTSAVHIETILIERNQALEEASKIKNDFIHHVSYELRSPLTNIIGFVQLLADGAAGPLSDKQRHYADYIMTSSDALLAIINNILDLVTIDAGVMTLDLGEVDIRAAAEAAAEGIQHRLAERSVTLDLRVAGNIGFFEADGRRLRQILFNLLSNAIGFSHRGGTVTLSAERAAGDVVFHVKDHGRGIPVAVQDRVFERFETHTAGSEHHGVGLGLSIVRSLVELHGGTVELESVEGRGTLVTCRFPSAAAQRREAAE